MLTLPKISSIINLKSRSIVAAITIAITYFFLLALQQLTAFAAPVTTTVTTNTPGLSVVVDGVTRQAPYDVTTDGSQTHTIFAPTIQTTTDGNSVSFVKWSDNGTQEHTITTASAGTVTADYQVVREQPFFKNGFEEGNLSAYPQQNIDVRPGNSATVTTEHPRSGNYSLKVSTGGTNPTAVIDQFFSKQNTIYQRSYISLPSSFTLQSGAYQNIIVLKNDQYQSMLTVTIDSSYRLALSYVNDQRVTQYAVGLGPTLPRDGSWHEIQLRDTVDRSKGQIELWLDGTRIANLSMVNSGLAGRDDIHVVSWGSYFSTVSNVNSMYFDDVSIAKTYISNTGGGFQNEILAAGFDLPTYAVMAPDGRIFVAQKDGVIKVVKNGAVLPTPLITIPNVNTYQDRGLISIALDPDFATNGALYAAFTYDINPSDFTGPKTARVVRYTVQGDTASPSSGVVILGKVAGTVTAPSCNQQLGPVDCIPSDGRTHTIGDMHFLADKTLVVSAGEGASDLTVNDDAMRAQNLDSLGGKFIRINRDGSAPTTNPFYTGDPNANRSKIWAYGFRNPFRWNIKPDTNTIIAGDVGWGAWEELDIVRAGGNYGWPCFEAGEYLVAYSGYSQCAALQRAGTALAPLYYYPHPPGSAVVGGVYYSGTAYPAKYQGAYFFGDFAQNKIWTLQIGANEQLVSGTAEEFPLDPEGPVQIFNGPNGDLYYLSIYTGQLRRIFYIQGNLPPTAVATGTPTNGSTPLTVQFNGAGSSDSDGTVSTYNWDFGDGGTAAVANPQHTYTTPGTYTATLTIRDDNGASATSSVTINAGNSAPVITLTTPAEGAKYTVNVPLNFVATATDKEDGTIPASALSWNIILHHCEPITQTCHNHPFLSGTGGSGTFTPPDHGEDVWLELVITARDSAGLTASFSRRIDANLTTLTLNTNPSGGNVAANGNVYTTPRTLNVPVNGSVSLFAPSPQTIGGTERSFVSWSNGGSQTQTITVSSPTTVTANFTGGTTPTTRTWNSYDLTLQSGTPQARVPETNGTLPATVELYESANTAGVDTGAAFTTFTAGNHPEGFNNVATFYTRTGSSPTGYPYIGKSSIDRGTGAGETGAPAPTGVKDVQIHPAENDHLIVTAFVVPADGTYTLSNLGMRRVLGWGDRSILRVFNTAKTQIATLDATSRAWTTSTTTYNLGALKAGDKIYFGVDRAGSFVGDATEIAWTLQQSTASTTPTPTTTPSKSWNSYDVTIQSGTPQATVKDSTNTTATVELYESADNGGVDLGSLFTTFTAGNHPEGFNNIATFYTRTGSSPTGYPYIAKSSTDRSSVAGETNIPTPTGVKDIQIHPAENDHLIVAAFIVPEDGTYIVSGLGTRRVLTWGTTSTFRVFNPAKTLVAALQATSNAWVTSTTAYSLGALKAGDKIYFAVDRDGSFVGDATEITWRVTKN